MDGYVPGDSLAHRLDPRTKLAFQAAFAAAAFAHTTVSGLVALTALALLVARLAATPLSVLRAYRGLLPFLVGAPVVAAVRLRPPYVDPAAAVDPALAGYRLVLVVIVSAAYLRTSTARESRAAVQWLLPGRVGSFLGLCVGFVLRFMPVLREDFGRIRAAEAARLGTERPLRERIRAIGVAGLGRLFARSDRFALALRARCLAWNPTLPELAFGRADWPCLGASLALLAWALV